MEENLQFVGHFMGTFDTATIVTLSFYTFLFLGLINYLRMEDRREGYPLEDDLSGKLEPMGPHACCAPKTFHLKDGRTHTVPFGKRDTRPVKARPSSGWSGSPLEPIGDPIIDGVGPASYAERANVIDPMWDGSPRIQPLSVDTHIWLESSSPDPRGMQVVAADAKIVGQVTDIWVDRAELLVRYYQVALDGGKVAMVPFTRAIIDAKQRMLFVSAIDSKHFQTVPGIANPAQITLLEEDKILGYFSGGGLYTKKAW